MFLKMAELSTVHLTPQTANLLDNEKWCEDNYLIVYKKDECGWFIPVIEPHGYYWENMASEILPHDLYDCFKYAAENNCKYLAFDCDAETIDELQTYEWG